MQVYTVKMAHIFSTHTSEIEQIELLIGAAYIHMKCDPSA